jgi:hypothetical protein
MRNVFQSLFLLFFAACTTSNDSGGGEVQACDAVPMGGVFRPEQLPSGACTTEPPCRLGVTARCPECPGVDGPDDVWRCDCVNGQWSCKIELAGLTACRAARFCDGGLGGIADAASE